MNHWKSLVICTLLLGGCAEHDPVLSGVHFLKFHADWCKPCRAQKPIVERLERDFSSVTFHHVDVDKQTELTQKYGVESIPCMVITVDGREKERFLGLCTYSDLSAALTKHGGTNKGADGRSGQSAVLAVHP